MVIDKETILGLDLVVAQVSNIIRIRVIIFIFKIAIFSRSRVKKSKFTTVQVMIMG